MATKKNDSERLDEASMLKVISGLEQEKPITKKLACEILNISYNTTRLAALIEKFKENKAREAKRRADLKGKAASNDEISFIISGYLEGETIDGLSKSTYRSTNFVKGILDKYSVPMRASSHNYFKPELIPEGAVRERFTVGEVVYSARYDSIARIDAEQHDPRNGWVYRIWLLAEKWQENAYQPAEELASLEHLRVLGVRI